MHGYTLFQTGCKLSDMTSMTCRHNHIEWLSTNQREKKDLTIGWLCKKCWRWDKILELWFHLWAHKWCQAKARYMHLHSHPSGSLCCWVCTRHPSVVPTQQLVHSNSTIVSTELLLDWSCFTAHHLRSSMLFTIIHIIIIHAGNTYTSPKHIDFWVPCKEINYIV
jgi:hypothetical protein